TSLYPLSLHDALPILLSPRPGRQLPGFYQGFLEVEKVIRQLLDRQASRLDSWLAASVQGVLLFQILGQRSIRIVPRTKVVQLPANFLGPAPGRMREQWEVGIGLAWLDRRDRMMLRHGDLLLYTGVTVSRPAGSN